MFLHEDDLPEGTSLSFLEQLNWIFRLIGSDDAGDWACRPPHGEFGCRHSAEHARVPRGAGTRKRSTLLSCRAWRPMEHPVTDGETVHRIPLQTEAQDDAEAGVGASSGSERTHSQDEGWHERQGSLSRAYRGLQRWLHDHADAGDRRSRRHGDAEPETVGGARSARNRINYGGGAQRDGGGNEIRTGGQRLGSEARGGIAVDGPLETDRQAGAILGLIAVLILACCNEKPKDDNEASTPSETTSVSSLSTSSKIDFVINVSHCAEGENLKGEEVDISVYQHKPGISLKRIEGPRKHEVNGDSQVEHSLSVSGYSNSVFGFQARHKDYGDSSFVFPKRVFPGKEHVISLCFYKMPTKNFKGSEYAFKKWDELMRLREFDGLCRVISGNFEKLRLRSKHWNDWEPKEVSKLGLQGSASKKMFMITIIRHAVNIGTNKRKKPVTHSSTPRQVF